MRRLPASRPKDCVDATTRDAWPVFVIGLCSIAIAMWRFPAWRWLTLAAFGLLLLEVIAFMLLGYVDLAVWLGSFVFALLLGATLVVAGHTLWRLIDPNRLVLLPPTRDACLDVVFKARNRVSLANHARVFSATSAPALRQSTASWLESLGDRDLDIRAQNMIVAEHYIRQFPQLKASGRDWLGHVRLSTASR
ncbi:hypothetical protein AB0O14_00945 [Microbacterium foliorum]